MGQKCIALLLGVTLDEELDRRTRADDDRIWEDYELPAERRLAERPSLTENMDCLGYVFACEEPNEGEADLSEKSLRIEEVAAAFPAEIAEAWRRWDLLADWLAREIGVELPTPGIFITLVERA